MANRIAQFRFDWDFPSGSTGTVAYQLKAVRKFVRRLARQDRKMTFFISFHAEISKQEIEKWKNRKKKWIFLKLGQNQNKKKKMTGTSFL